MPRKPARKSQAKRKTAAPSVRKSGAQGADAAPAPIPVRHGRFDYSPIVDRPPLRWPNGARVAVWVIPNIEHFLFDRPSTSISDATYALRPDVLNYSWRDFGVRVGIWRMMEIMEKYGVRGTVALNSDVCGEYPRIIEEGNRLGWEWMGHGTTNSTLLSRLPEKEERALIKEAVTTIGDAVGKAPRGWLSPALSEIGAHARYPGRERRRIRRQLGQRRAALSDEGQEGPDVLDAVFVGDQ